MNQFDLTGFWKTSSGAVYKIQNECGYFVALYWLPSAGQAAMGYKQGDCAFKGDLVGKVLAGQFYHRFPLEVKDRFPGMWELRTTIYLQVADTGDKMTGLLLLTHLPDCDCKPDDRMLQELVFERVVSDDSAAVVPAMFVASHSQNVASGG